MQNVNLKDLVLREGDKNEKKYGTEQLNSKITRNRPSEYSPLAHLHLHTFHSILDGCGSIDNYIKLAKEYNQPAIAITDHGTASGTLEMWQKCKAAGIKPIIGVEFYVNDKMGDFEEPKFEGGNAHQIVLVKNKEGFVNMNKLLYKSFDEGFYKRGRIKTEWLLQHKEGLVITTACIGHTIGKLFQDNNLRDAEAYFKLLKDQFGDDFYAEIQLNELDIQKKYNAFLIGLSKRYQVKVVLAADVHYAYPEDAELQDTLLAINQKKDLSNSFKFNVRSLYFSSSEDFHNFNISYGYNYPREFIELCLKNTLEVAEKCNFNFETGLDKTPKYEVTPDAEKYFGTRDTAEIITRLAFAKLRQKIEKYKINKIVDVSTPEKIQAYIDRLNYELKVISDKNVLDYFLVNWEVINNYRKKGKVIGPGRGSAAGSLLTWCLDITTVDPMRFGLYFERFLNPDRKCITKNNEVLMKDGSYKNIMDITLEDKFNIQTEKGIGVLVDIVDRELEDGEDVYQIETVNGGIVELTGNHIVPVFRNCERIDVRVDQILEDDYLITF